MKNLYFWEIMWDICSKDEISKVFIVSKPQISNAICGGDTPAIQASAVVLFSAAKNASTISGSKCVPDSSRMIAYAFSNGMALL